ncbi:MAG TPA: DUF4279 domain-containing protein [Roseiflexaceae bacterium]|nr:DUF4279 domain-containing protein [Roseiflexaceae bacterium]
MPDSSLHSLPPHDPYEPPDPPPNDDGEADEEPYFCFTATLRIFGERLDLEEITRQMGLEPTGTHHKGDRRSERAQPYPHDMWRYEAPVDDDQPLAVHIDRLWADIRHAAPFLRELKQIATVDIFLGYRSNWPVGQVPVPLACLEMFVELDMSFGLSVIVM